MGAADYNLTIEQGATYNLNLVYSEDLKKLSTITRSSTTATATMTGHGFATNDYVLIVGADQAEYNGVFQVTVTDENTFTFTVSGTPRTPATGTIQAGQALDLTGYTATLQLNEQYDSTTPIDTLTTAGGEIVITADTGTIDITIDEFVTTDYDFDEGSYDLEIVKSGEVFKIMRGSVKLLKQVKR